MMRVKLLLTFLPIFVAVKTQELETAEQPYYYESPTATNWDQIEHVVQPIHKIPRPIPKPISVQQLLPASTTASIIEPTASIEPQPTTRLPPPPRPVVHPRQPPRFPLPPRPVPKPTHIGIVTPKPEVPPIPEPVPTEPNRPAKPNPRPPRPILTPRPVIKSTTSAPPTKNPEVTEPNVIPNKDKDPQSNKPETYPIPQPVPQPRPKPQPIPKPTPTPVPQPRPKPTPIPKPRPTPVPYPSSSLRYPTPRPIPPNPKPKPLEPFVEGEGIPVDYNCLQDGYFPVPNECDTYIECRKSIALKYMCPDGLHFNRYSSLSEYPCGYPSEVRCENNAVSQKPQPTSECPHQYGYVAMNDGDCSRYLSCQEGVATIMRCPLGLVFNPEVSSCDWLENVPSCKPAVFQGFACPPTPLDENGEPYDWIYKYKYGQSCKEYIACQRGQPRLLSCDPGLSFDEESETCIDSDYVPNCSAY